MLIATFLAVYGISWWLTLFVILPLGIKSQFELGDVTPGTEAGAPGRPRLWRKVIITTLVAIPVAIALSLFIQFVE
jgi:predicted secreted protein